MKLNKKVDIKVKNKEEKDNSNLMLDNNKKVNLLKEDNNEIANVSNESNQENVQN